MKKLTLLFPGQGSQYVGMGQENQKFLDQANKSLNLDLKTLCLNGPIEELTLTQNAQPAIVAYSIAMFEKLKTLCQGKATFERCLGHSVGEYSALCAAEVFSFDDAVKLVHLRGKYMQEAVPAGLGAMIAIMRAPLELVKEACLESSNQEEQVMCANFNDPAQVVISGHSEACSRVVEYLKKDESLKFRSIPLKVSAPFHSSLMKPAEKNMENEIKNIKMNENKIPYIANIDAKEYSTQTKPESIANNLIKQICGSVLWLQSIQNLTDEAICIEVGPGKVLKGLVKKINPNIKVLSMDEDSFEEQIKEILG